MLGNCPVTRRLWISNPHSRTPPHQPTGPALRRAAPRSSARGAPLFGAWRPALRRAAPVLRRAAPSGSAAGAHTPTRASCLCHPRMARPKGYHRFPGCSRKVLRGTSKSFQRHPGNLWSALPGHAGMTQARSPRSCSCVILGGSPAGEALLIFGIALTRSNPRFARVDATRSASARSNALRALERAGALSGRTRWRALRTYALARSQDQKRRSPRGRPPGVEGRRFVPRTTCRRQPRFGPFRNR